MATDFKQRLQNLKQRRLGIDALAKSAALSDLRFADAASRTESYETRAKSDALKYGLGAMQEVDGRYTAICYEDGERVRAQLASGLAESAIRVTFDYQGSVPLNIHIRGTSDVDLLVLHDEFVTVDPSGPQAHTYSHTGKSVIGEMGRLRSNCEQILPIRFPAATVNCGGSKSIRIEGGSLRRKIDVVPAHWHHTATYQASSRKHDREICILDTSVPTTIGNRPFMHMHCINAKDTLTKGGAKKVIRLLKNLSKDSGRGITLSSYDIAALTWHFDDASLNRPWYLEVALIAETQDHLHRFLQNRPYCEALMVPDQSRKIIDSPVKFASLIGLSMEVDELAAQIARELDPMGIQTPQTIRKRLSEAYV